MADRPHIGFVGLGNMGGPLAERLAKAGYPLTVFDIDKKARDAFAKEHGIDAAGELKTLGADAEVVITCLPNGAVVRQVLTENGLADALKKNTLVIDMSSSDPVGTEELGEEIRKNGLRMVDAPVSGGVTGAKKGALAIMAGGEKRDVDEAWPVLENFGQKIFHTGKLGTGQAMKALNNLCSATGLVIVLECLLAGQKFGLKPAVMVDVLNASSGRNNSSENKLKQFVLSRTFGAGFAMDLMVKDLNTALDLARTMRTPMPLGLSSVGIWMRALEEMTAETKKKKSPDHTAITEWLEDQTKGQVLK